jgi:hypothetical protein
MGQCNRLLASLNLGEVSLSILNLSILSFHRSVAAKNTHHWDPILPSPFTKKVTLVKLLSWTEVFLPVKCSW